MSISYFEIRYRTRYNAIIKSSKTKVFAYLFKSYDYYTYKARLNTFENDILQVLDNYKDYIQDTENLQIYVTKKDIFITEKYHQSNIIKINAKMLYDYLTEMNYLPHNTMGDILIHNFCEHMFFTHVYKYKNIPGILQHYVWRKNKNINQNEYIKQWSTTNHTELSHNNEL